MKVHIEPKAGIIFLSYVFFTMQGKSTGSIILSDAEAEDVARRLTEAVKKSKEDQDEDRRKADLGSFVEFMA